MIRPLLALFAASCATLPEGVLPDEPLPEGWAWDDAGLERVESVQAFALVFDQEPLVPDSRVVFSVTGAAPNDLVRFLYSTNGTGAGPCLAQLGNLCVDILGPLSQFGTATADGLGTAELRVRIPAGAPQIFLFTQAVIDRGANSVKTNVITAPILAGALDDDLDGFCEGNVCADPNAIPGDCDDDEPNAFPGATDFHPLPYNDGNGPTFDYDCDGLEEVESTDEYRCNTNGGGPSCPHRDGWDFGVVPGCGEIGTFSSGCIDFLFPVCFAALSDSYAVQRCR